MPLWGGSDTAGFRQLSCLTPCCAMPAWAVQRPQGLAGWEGSLSCFNSTGGTDKLGRALLQVTTSSSAWGAAWCSAAELARLLLCLCSLPR